MVAVYAGSMTSRAVVVLASNRGPVSFVRNQAGRLRPHPGAGGLVAALSAVCADAGLPGDSGARWICAALDDADRAAARSVPGGRLDRSEVGWDVGRTPVRMLDIDPSTFRGAYNGVANRLLWFVHHLLFDTANRPVFDEEFRRDWAEYQAYADRFARAIADEAAREAKVVVQDYHLTLVPRLVRELRPDLRVAHFSHTPWAPPEYFRVLPDDITVDLLEGVLAADQAGFLSARWARAFLACCETVLSARVEYAPAESDDREIGTVTHEGRTTRIQVFPLGVDAEAFRARADASDVRERMAALGSVVGDRRVLVRVDRSELSKNIVRGLLAYRELLRARPVWRGQVVHLVFAYPSRHDLPEYREYAATVRRTADEIIEEFRTPDWTPLVLAVEDDLPRSLAAYRLADVAVVDPVRDGMNLVAKEIAIASDRGCALVLSREAGAADELGAAALLVNPFDVLQTADAMHRALSMDPAERRSRAARLAAAAGAYPPGRWLGDQLDGLESSG